MSKIKILLATGLSLLFISCNNKPTLQNYFVKNQDQPNFIALDIAPNILKLDHAKLTNDEANVLKSFEKINVLAFKVNQKNKDKYNLEKNKLVEILQDTASYHQLIKIGSGAMGANISFVGDENHINEFVFFGNKKENGFVVARILGNNMKPENAMKLFSILQKGAIDEKQLGVLKDLFK